MFPYLSSTNTFSKITQNITRHLRPVKQFVVGSVVTAAALSFLTTDETYREGGQQRILLQNPVMEGFFNGSREVTKCQKKYH